MALSEREQKLLDEMERGLYAGDAKFSRAVNEPKAVSAKRLVLGAVLAVVGLSLLVFAVVIQLTVFGVIAFAVMLAGVIVASSRVKLQMPQAKPEGAAGSKPKSNPFEDRWDRRIDGQ